MNRELNWCVELYILKKFSEICAAVCRKADQGRYLQSPDSLWEAYSAYTGCYPSRFLKTRMELRRQIFRLNKCHEANGGHQEHVLKKYSSD